MKIEEIEIPISHEMSNRINGRILDTLSKSFFSIPHFNSGIDHFILLKWGIDFRNWIPNAGIEHFILLKWGIHFRNWESMPEVNSLLDCVRIWNFEFKKLAIAFSCPKSWFRRVVISIFARDWVSDLRYLVRECL